MRVLHLASFDHWTGATAPAFAEVEALREAGIDARFAFVGGSTLQEKIGGLDFTYPVLGGSEAPWSMLRGVRAIRRLLRAEKYEILHAHLTYDHVMAELARTRLGVPLVRTFHASRPMRRDPLSRRFLARADALAVVNATFLDSPLVSRRGALFTPPPVSHRLFRPEGRNARSLYHLSENTPVIGVIGKISHGRGFEAALQAFDGIHARIREARLLVIGHGYHRRNLERLAENLGIGAEVIWAGYHEDDLPQHYRAMDLMLFTAAGSDEGHRAVSEAMACGTPVACYPIPGVAEILGELAAQLLASEASPDTLAPLAARLLATGAARRLRSAAAASTERFGYRATAERLVALYARAREQMTDDR